MAGSQVYRVYQTDFGEKYSVEVAKHVAVAVVRGGVRPAFELDILFAARDANYPPLPHGFKMRFVVCHPYNDLLHKKKHILIPVGSPNAFRLAQFAYNSIEFLSGVQFNQSRYWLVSRTTGESRAIPPRVDDAYASI